MSLDLFGEPVREETDLGAEFGLPPFTVLDRTSGQWLTRRRAWMALGIRSEIGRANGLAFNNKAWAEANGKSAPDDDTSVFDPVICEMAYRWFSPTGGLVLDPFAGGSVRGIVAAMMGLRYHGLELRAEQVLANRAQHAALCRGHEAGAEWFVGDALDMEAMLPPSRLYDFLLTCPPYFDLEVYSDDPRDLSAMSADAFAVAYRAILRAALRRLWPDRFACVVVGDVRDGAGMFRDLRGLTIDACEAAGARLYNDLILVGSVGSLSMRAPIQFRATRKLGMRHQHLLVFCKGSPERATSALNTARALEEGTPA